MKIGFFRAPILGFAMAAHGTNASFAQSGWYWQNPLPQGNPLVDANTGTAVGNFGTILRTNNGGR